jgi:hypothetical protein
MSEELADSGSESTESGIDMDAAMDSISSDLFGVEPESEQQEVEAKQEVEPEQVEPEQEEQVEQVETRHAPQSWKKEMHEFWNGLDPAVQDYVEQREEQMREGLEKDRDDANRGRDMRDIMSPYEGILKSQGIDQSALMRNLMNAHYRLSTADDAGRVGLIRQLAQSYNVSLDGEQKEVDPALKAMQDKVSSLENHYAQSQQHAQQVAHDRVSQDVDAFASDPAHEFFDEVSEQIVPLINAGYDLEDAYQNAIWLNPVTRQKEIDRTAKDAETKALDDAKKEAQKAQKAKAVNVRGRDTSKASTEPTGTMEDTMREVYRDIQSRSH